MLRLLTACLCLGLVLGHGIVWWPPGRSSLWRHGFDSPPNYRDNELYCGGYSFQWNVNGGKCGVCGDPWGRPQENQPGPDNIYANGIIGDVYEPGQVMDIDVDIHANHMGWFEFRLCPVNNPSVPATQDCLDQYLLELADGSGTRYVLPDKNNRVYRISVRLPAGLTCSQCVLQWKYNTGNSWNRDPDTGRECVGCGPQEQFYACSDIAIGDDAVTAPSKGPTVTQPTNSDLPTPSPWPTYHPDANCKAIGAWEGNPAWDSWCTANCAHFPPNCPEDTCFCTSD